MKNETPAESALRELIRLKDGPRDEAYAAAKERAWQAARDSIAGPATPGRDLLHREDPLFPSPNTENADVRALRVLLHLKGMLAMGRLALVLEPAKNGDAWVIEYTLDCGRGVYRSDNVLASHLLENAPAELLARKLADQIGRAIGPAGVNGESQAAAAAVSFPPDLDVTAAVPWRFPDVATPMQDLNAVRLTAMHRYGRTLYRLAIMPEDFAAMRATRQFCLHAEAGGVRPATKAGDPLEPIREAEAIQFMAFTFGVEVVFRAGAAQPLPGTVTLEDENKKPFARIRVGVE